MQQAESSSDTPPIASTQRCASWEVRSLGEEHVGYLDAPSALHALRLCTRLGMRHVYVVPDRLLEQRRLEANAPPSSEPVAPTTAGSTPAPDDLPALP